MAGAADTIAVLTRPRNETTGLLKITGRDVGERGYAVSAKGGRWKLEGKSFEEATRAAQAVRASANLGDRSAEILRLVDAHPQGITAKQVASQLGDVNDKDAGTYLRRLHESSKIAKHKRGLCPPPIWCRKCRNCRNGGI